MQVQALLSRLWVKREAARGWAGPLLGGAEGLGGGRAGVGPDHTCRAMKM